MNTYRAKAQDAKVVDLAAYSGTLPPQNLEVEEAVLGGALLDPSAMPRLIEVLKPGAFYLQAHQRIFDACVQLHCENKPVDLMTVLSKLMDSGALSEIGGQEKLVSLVANTVSAINIDRYAEIINDKYHRRKLISVGNEVSVLAHDATVPLVEAADKIQKKVFEATTFDLDRRWESKPVSDLMVGILSEMQSGAATGFRTGLADLDALTNGLHKSDLVVIAGRAGLGKTFFGCHLADYFIRHSDLPVVFFSAEMDRSKLLKRFISKRTNIDLSRILRHDIHDEDEWGTVISAFQQLADSSLFINDTPASQLTPHLIRSELRRIQSLTGKETGLVIIDYLQKLGDRSAHNRAQVVGHYAGECKDIAKEFDCPVVALAQINREVEKQSDKRPTIAQLKDSGDIEQDADVILLLYREDYYDQNSSQKNVLEINVAKNRNGANGACKVFFRPETGFYGSLAENRGY